MVEAAGAMPAEEPQLPMDGERFLPDLMNGEIALEHLHRYRFASQFVVDKEVLDIASGEGYGSAWLAKFAHGVIGVDVAQPAIDHARRKYCAVNLEFRVGSCAQIPLDDKSVDVVVSFETIEHHVEHEAMMIEIKRVLRPGGLLVISSPDRLIYSDRPNTQNSFHVKELYRDEFEALLGAHFERFRIHGQRILIGSSIFAETDRGKVAFESLQSDKVSLGQPANPVYLVALASDGKLPAVSGSLLEGELAPAFDDSPVVISAIKLLAHRDSAALSAALHNPWYLKRNADLVAAKIEPVQHWWSHGADEGRTPSANMRALVAAILAELKSAAHPTTFDDPDRAVGEHAIAEKLAETSRQFAADAERDRGAAQALSRLQQDFDAQRQGVSATLESAVTPLRQAQAKETEIVHALLKVASGEMHAFRAEVKDWRESTVTPWMDEQRKAVALLANNLAAENLAKSELLAQAVEGRQLAERNALAQFRANRVLSDQVSSINVQIEADHLQVAQLGIAIDGRLGESARQAHDKMSAMEVSLTALIEKMWRTLDARLDSDAEKNRQWRQQLAHEDSLFHKSSKTRLTTHGFRTPVLHPRGCCKDR